MTVRRGKLVAWTTFVLVFAAISYTLNFTTKNSNDVLYTWGAAVSGVFQYALLLGIVLLISRPESKLLLALRRPRSWPRAVALGAAAIFCIYAFAAVLSPFVNPGKEQGLLPNQWEPSHAAAFAANFVVVAGVAPFVEELMFRGLGYSLLEPFGPWVAILGVGLAFGLAHGLVQALPLLAAFGSALAYLRRRTDSVVPGMIVHGLFNAIALAAAVTAS